MNVFLHFRGLESIAMLYILICTSSFSSVVGVYLFHYRSQNNGSFFFKKIRGYHKYSYGATQYNGFEYEEVLQEGLASLFILLHR